MLIRVRSHLGCHRVNDLEDSTATLADIKEKLGSDWIQHRYYQDPSFKDELCETTILTDQGLKHGSMIYCRHIEKTNDSPAGHAATGTNESKLEDSSSIQNNENKAKKCPPAVTPPKNKTAHKDNIQKSIETRQTEDEGTKARDDNDNDNDNFIKSVDPETIAEQRRILAQFEQRKSQKKQPATAPLAAAKETNDVIELLESDDEDDDDDHDTKQRHTSLLSSNMGKTSIATTYRKTPNWKSFWFPPKRRRRQQQNPVVESSETSNECSKKRKAHDQPDLQIKPSAETSTKKKKHRSIQAMLDEKPMSLDTKLSFIVSHHGDATWFWLRNKNTDPKEGNLVGLSRDWKELLKSHKKPALKDVVNLSINNRVLGGKWMLHVEPGDSMNHKWDCLKKMMQEGICTTVKISPSPHPKNKLHLVCVYVSDFTNKEQVDECLRRIRTFHKVERTLRFKCDGATYLDLYQGNEWNIKLSCYNHSQKEDEEQEQPKSKKCF